MEQLLQWAAMNKVSIHSKVELLTCVLCEKKKTQNFVAKSVVKVCKKNCCVTYGIYLWNADCLWFLI